MVGSIMVVGVLTCCALFHLMCNLETTQINVLHSLIRELMLYEFVLETTKNICCVKVESAVDSSTITRWLKKFCLNCKNIDNQARLGRPKTMDSDK